jgi:hypothetical protein
MTKPLLLAKCQVRTTNAFRSSISFDTVERLHYNFGIGVESLPGVNGGTCVGPQR